MGLKSMAAGTLMREEDVIQWGCTPVIPAIQEAGVGGSLVQSQPAGTREMVLRLLQGNWVWFPAPTWKLITLSNSKRLSSLCGQQVHKEYTHMHASRHSSTENKKP